MEREASPWCLEPRDVQSPDEIGSPEGSLKGEGGSAPPRGVPQSGRGDCGPWEGKRARDLDTWDLEEARAGSRCPGFAEGEVEISAPAQGPATVFEKEGEICDN